MSFELGWNILPIIVTLLAFGFAVIVHGIALVLASEISGPFRDVTSFFSDAGIIFALVLYLVAGVVSAIAWGIYYFVT